LPATNERIPAAASDQVRHDLEIDDRALTLLECRPPWNPEGTPKAGTGWTASPVVRFRYVKARHEWVTYVRGSDGKFHRFELIEPSSRIEELLAAVDDDPSGSIRG
jgi:hypothetical protein